MTADHTQLAADYDCLRSDVGVVDFSHRTQIEVTGRDRASFIHNFCTNDIKKLSPGLGCEAFVTNMQGKTLGHVYVFADLESLHLETSAGQAEPLLKHLDRYLIREEVQLVDRSTTWSELLVAGPRAESLLQDVFGKTPQPGRLSQVDATCGDNRVLIRRSDFLQVPTFFLVVAPRVGNPREATDSLRHTLQLRGARPCSLAAVEALRIEARTPIYGQDITADNLPQELARDDRAISFTKGCYLGQEPVARIDALGHVNRTLVAIRCDDPTITGLPLGLELKAAEKVVGSVTSFAFSPQTQTLIALAYVRRGANGQGSKLSSAIGTVTIIST